MAETETKTSHFPAWVKILLVLSLALNLAVIGLVGGFFMRVKDKGSGPGAVNYAIPYIIALPREDRRAIGEILRQKAQRGEIEGRRGRMAEYNAMLVLLRADSFDVAAANSILDLQGAAAQARQAAASAAWLERVTAFTPAVRATYADSLEAVLNRAPKGKKKGQK